MSHEPTNAPPHHATPSGPQPPSPPPREEAREADGSLKYHLLGPSLQKSGQDGVDQTKAGLLFLLTMKRRGGAAR